MIEKNDVAPFDPDVAALIEVRDRREEIEQAFWYTEDGWPNIDGDCREHALALAKTAERLLAERITERLRKVP